MRRRELLAGLVAAAVAGGCAGEAPRWARATTSRYSRLVELPAPSRDGAMSVERAIARRRSVRAFRPDPLPVSTIGQLLWAAQGTTGSQRGRAAPSAGALYPLELYAVTADQVMHYLPDGHRVEVRDSVDLRPLLRTSALGQQPLAEAPLLLVVAAAPDRTRRRYGARATSFVAMEAGHAAQNILLEAVALGLGAVPIGSLDGPRAAETLAVPPDQTVLYVVPVGLPR